MKRGFRFLIISFVLFASFSNFVIPEKANASLTQTDLDRWTKYGNDTFVTSNLYPYKNDYLDISTTVFNAYKNIQSVTPVIAFGYILKGVPNENYISTVRNKRNNSSVYLGGMYGIVIDQILSKNQLTAKQVNEALDLLMQHEILYSQQKNGIITTPQYIASTTEKQADTQQKIDALQKVKEDPSIGLGSISGNPNTKSSATNYVLLEPSVQGLPGNLLAGSNGKVAIGNSIGDVTSFIFVILVTASLIAAVFMIMAGAFTRMTTDSVYKKTEGSEKIRNAVYGLLAVLTMYLIILFINPDMLRKGLNPDSYKITNIKTPSTGNAVTATPQVDAITGADYNISDAANRKLLSDAGIGINKNNCTQTQLNAGGMQSCTSLDGLPRQTIDMLISLKTDCEKKYSSCPLVVTGGTEPGHASHGKGLFPVDLRCSGKSSSGCDTSENLYKFLDKLGWTRTTKKCFFGRVYGPYQNFYFCNEINSDIHWHVYK